MRIIRIIMLSDEQYKPILKRVATEMGLMFFESKEAINENSSFAFWQQHDSNVKIAFHFNYQIAVKDNKMTFTDFDNSKTIEERINEDILNSRIKRLILDEESLTYMGKTKNQISGNHKKMKRLRKLEGFFQHNVVKTENPDTQSISLGNGIMKNSRITIYGENNTLIIEDGYYIDNMELLIRGNNNTVHIGKSFELNYNTDHGPLYLSAKDNNNNINLGDNIHIRGSAEIVCMEGTSIAIGDNFGMSNETIIRSGDGHRIIDRDGTRSNLSKSITIGSDCWLARRGIILKGVELKDYTIVGTGALVTKKYEQGNIVLGGNPARIIKKDVTWFPGR